jgi:hypothetical protein
MPTKYFGDHAHISYEVKKEYKPVIVLCDKNHRCNLAGLSRTGIQYLQSRLHRNEFRKGTSDSVSKKTIYGFFRASMESPHERDFK